MPEQIDGDSYAHFWVFLGGCCMCCLGWILVENFGMSNGAAAVTTIAVTIPTVIFAVSRLAKAEAAFNAKERAEEAKAKTPAAARTFGNTPLAAQSGGKTPPSGDRTFGNVPLSQQKKTD